MLARIVRATRIFQTSKRMRLAVLAIRNTSTLIVKSATCASKTSKAGRSTTLRLLRTVKPTTQPGAKGVHNKDALIRVLPSVIMT